MRASRWLAITCVAAAVAAAGCGGSGEAGSTAAAGRGGDGGGYEMVFLPKLVGISYFEKTFEGAQEAAGELGDEVSQVGPTEATAQAQVPFINTIATQRPDALFIAGNDPQAVVPALKAAANRGVEIFAFDSDVDPSVRIANAGNPTDEDMAQTYLDMLGEQIDYRGDFAFLSTTPTATAQNEWIAVMRRMLATPRYEGMNLVKIAYYNEDAAQATKETEGLLSAYPDLRGIISLGVTGTQQAARVAKQKGVCDKVVVTGEALPSLSRQDIKSGCVKQGMLWDPADVGYLAVYLGNAVLSGEIRGTEGETFDAGRLGERTVGPDGFVPLGKPVVFTKENIDDYDF